MSEDCLKGVRSRKPLVSLSVMKEPFERIAMDIVGPLLHIAEEQSIHFAIML